MRKLFSCIIFFSIVSLNSCTDLQEQILDESLNAQGDGPASLLAPSYAVLPEFYLHTNYFTLQEITTDEAILPYRGGTDWGDNGKFMELHRHTFTSTNAAVNDGWNSVMRGLSYAVSAISKLSEDGVENSEENNRYIAEARALRAFYSMNSLDLFGLVFVKDQLDATSTILRGADAVDYIESELLDVLDRVDNNVGPGRITQNAAKGLLARLYLNAPVYRDIYADNFNFTAEDMDNVIRYCTEIINSGNYQLSPEFFEIFDDENHNNPELIFAIDQRADLNGHNRMAYFSLSGNQFPLPQFPRANGTDGAAITSDYYQTWEDAYAPLDPADADPRFFKHNLDTTITCIDGADFEIDRGILRGQQYGLQTASTGSPFERCDNGGFVVGKIYNTTRSRPNEPVIFTRQIDFTTQGSYYSTGYRIEKYEFSKKSDTGRNNGEADIVILRLADIYLMRAEAYLRKGNAAEALADVNTIRAARTARLTAPALPGIDLETLYRERGFELYWEHQRRTDMIRFGKYEDSWTEKNNSDKTRRIFPIPQSAIDAASEQPGYLVQNEGY